MRSRALRAALAVVLIAAAWAVNEAAPTSLDVQAPFPVEGEAGERLTGRNISAVVLPKGTTLRTADVLEVDGTEVTELRTSGVFLLVPVRVSNVVAPEGLQTAHLEIGGARYTSITRRLDYADAWVMPLSVGIDRQAEVVFEVPRSALERADEVYVELALTADVSLDSLARARVETAHIEHVKRAGLAEVVEEVS